MASKMGSTHSATVYKSPQVDIDRKYGTVSDVDELIEKLGQCDTKLTMDLVVNHTSNQVTYQLSDGTNSDYASAFLVSRVTLFSWYPQARLVHLEEGQSE